MDRDDQQLVKTIELSVDRVQMDTEDSLDSELQTVSSTRNEKWWSRAQLKEILHSQKAQYVIIGLVVLDCVVIIAQLIVDLQVLEVSHEHPTHHALHYTSIAILSVFMIELMLKIYAMGLEYFKHKLEVFDGIIVVVSFSLDLAFSSSVVGSAALLVLLRLWRVTRIVNGIILSVKMKAEQNIEELLREKEEMQRELEKLIAKNQELENLVNKLKDGQTNSNSEESQTS